MMDPFKQLMSGPGRFLSLKGVPPDLLTLTGLVLCAAAGMLTGRGAFIFAGALALLAGACDLLDGAVARNSGLSSPAGALLDSSLDRYSDAFLMGGLAMWFCVSGSFWGVILALSAMAACFEISYVRARSEGLGVSNDAGFWERGERLVFFMLAVGCAHPRTAVLVLGTAPHVTAVRRLVDGRRKLMAKALSGSGGDGAAVKRRRPGYWLVSAVWILLALAPEKFLFWFAGGADF